MANESKQFTVDPKHSTAYEVMVYWSQGLRGGTNYLATCDKATRTKLDSNSFRIK